MRSKAVSDYAAKFKNNPGKTIHKDQANSKTLQSLTDSTKSFFANFPWKFKPNKHSKSRNKKVAKDTLAENYESNISSISNKGSRFLVNFFKFIGLIISLPFVLLGKASLKFLQKIISREKIFEVAVCTIFIVIVFRFAQLQIVTSSQNGAIKQSESKATQQILPSKRGQILINNFEKDKENISLTSTVPTFNIWFDPSSLKDQIDPKKDFTTLENITERLSGSLNIPYQSLYDTLKTEVTRPAGELKKYVVLQKYVSQELKKAVEYLRNPPQNNIDKNVFVVPYSTWLGVENVDMRLYPENTLLANTIGYVAKYPVSRSELASSESQCLDVALNNEKRGTSIDQYTIGYYGLEQKYCKELGGLNGKKQYNKDKGLTTDDQAKVVDGYNIHLTVDINLQKKAEEVLQNAMKKNTSPLGPPANGSVTIMDAKSGKIVALASNPTFNPNDTNFNSSASDTYSSPLRNVSTGLNYEVGSVMKPLTIAAALNEYKAGNKDKDGNRLGVPSDWKGGNYPIEGKPYPEKDYTKYIKNADGYPYDTPQSLSNILRDSINTGIADIVPTIGNKVLQDYITNKYRFGTATTISLPGDSSGNLGQVKKDQNLSCDICYANYGFGQGFQISPVQLLRAYSSLANSGTLVEPYLVDKITDSTGNTIDDGTGENSQLKRPPSAQVLDPQIAKDVTQYLVNTAEQGYHGDPKYSINIDGYYVAAKTGTSQIGNKVKYTGDCSGNAWIDCNTAKGLYEHTYVGYGPSTNPAYIIVIKLSEPQPGSGSKNFAVMTLTDSFKDIMEYTLNYMKIPKDKK